MRTSSLANRNPKGLKTFEDEEDAYSSLKISQNSGSCHIENFQAMNEASAEEEFNTRPPTHMVESRLSQFTSAVRPSVFVTDNIDCNSIKNFQCSSDHFHNELSQNRMAIQMPKLRQTQRCESFFCFLYCLIIATLKKYIFLFKKRN